MIINGCRLAALDHIVSYAQRSTLEFYLSVIAIPLTPVIQTNLAINTSSTRLYAPAAGGYVLQHHTRWCSAETIIATIEECSRAKAALDPNADAVLTENFKDAPKGCSLYKGNWIFNSHAAGTLDGVSMPVCKSTAGSERRDCWRGIQITPFYRAYMFRIIYHESYHVIVPISLQSAYILTCTGGFLVHHHTEWCTSATMLSTIEECTNAKTVLDPGADAVKTDNNKDAPKGCSRHIKTWYFNTVATGKLDGESEPICKAVAGWK